jgi:hypothetical protein
MNPGFGYNSSTDLINTNIAPNVIPSQVNFDLAPNSNYNPELIMSVPNSAGILTDFFGDLRNQTNTNAGAIELNPSLASLENIEIEFNVFPNPFKDEFMIITKEEYIGKEFQIFDISGKLVESASIYSTEQKHKISLKTGIYFLKIGDKTLKLISF